ncbi:hypothetical protein [Agarilytica rhodophyticola]|nr:hypothetical protein [Agarilytica rhodophyticola]
MKKILQKFSKILKKDSGGQKDPLPHCNYHNNYYGDQVCVRKSL